MTILLYLFTATAFALTAFLFYERAKWCLHMMQLDGYSNARFLRWLFQQPAERLLGGTQHLTFCAACCSCLLLFLRSISELGHASNWMKLAPALCLSLIAGLTLAIRSTPEPAKKPFVLTARAKRLIATICLLFLVTVLWPVLLRIVAPSLGTWHDVLTLCTLALIILSILLPPIAAGLTLIANILLIPVQSAINRSYVNKAKANLRAVNPTVVGITGSFGKTSTKYFLEALIRDSIPTLMTPQSFNSFLGIIRVLNENLRPGTELFIAEMGAYRPGDIKELADLLHPTIGILTAIGPSHLERFGTVDAVERTKYELIQSLPSTGLGVFNMDDPRCRRLSFTTPQPHMGYGLNNDLEDLDVWATDIRMTPQGMTFTIHTRAHGETAVRTPVLGKHNVSNILACVCVALHLGVSLDTLRRRMNSLEAAPHRLQLLKGTGGVTVIDDSYNSNPIGAAAALEVLSQFQSGKRILITPGMVELGSKQEEENEKFGELAATSADFVFLIAGASSEAIHRGLRNKGFPEDKIRDCKDLTEATTELPKIVSPGDVVLFANDLPDLYKAKS